MPQQIQFAFLKLELEQNFASNLKKVRKTIKSKQPSIMIRKSAWEISKTEDRLPKDAACFRVYKVV